MPSTLRVLSFTIATAMIIGLVPMSAVAQDAETSGSTQPTMTGRIGAAIEAQGVMLGGDPSAARDYLRENITYERYDGILKGDRGTFLTASGNGADQALLLVSLVRSTHPQVGLRFASCELDGRTLSAAGASPIDEPVLNIVYAEEIASLIDDPELSAAILEVARRRGVLKSQAGDASAYLAASLADAGYPWAIAPLDTPGTPLEHVWAQARIDGTWVDLDPISASGQPPCEASETFDQLPQAMEHRVVISVVAESRTDGSIDEGELLRAEFPTRELATARVAFLFGEPMGLLAPSTAAGFGLNPDPDAGLSSYTPMLRIDGRSIAGTPVAFPALGSFVADEIDDALGGALDLFGELPGGDEALVEADDDSDGIAAIWLDLELLTPRGQTTSLRSDVLDRIGLAARSAGTAASVALTPLEEVDGEYAELSTLWQIGLLLGQTRTTEGALDGRLDPLSIDGLSGHLDALLRSFPALRSDFGAQTSAPMIVLAGLRPVSDAAGQSRGRLLLDALHVPEASPSDAVAAARNAQATLAAEALLATIGGESGDEVRGVGAVMSTARAAGTPLQLLSPGDKIAIGDASPRALARMAARLENGQRLLVPAPAPVIDGIATSAWWSIDPTSGVVTDEHEDGRHAASAETAAGEARTVSFMDRIRRFGCRVARPAALAVSILYLGTGAGASPLHEILEEVVQAAEAEAERRAEREAAERAACGGS